MIDFGIGQPDLALMPLAQLQRAAAHRFSRPERDLLQYGAEQGDGYFLEALANFLSAGYGMSVAPESLFISNGISQALDLICTLFTQPGDLIFVEEPSYFLALRIFSDHHLRVVGVPVDENGLDLDALEEQLAEERPRFVYTIPTFQNPTGTTLPPSRRRRLVELSRKHGFYVLADEVYQLLAYTASPPAPFAGEIEGGTVISLGSFSKILAPGLRLGWVQAAPPVIKRLVGSGLLDSGGGLNPVASGIVRSALELGLQNEHLGYLKQVYQNRAELLSHSLRDHLSDVATFAEPQGGFFIWLKLLGLGDTAELLPIARQHQVSFQPGVKFSSQGGLNDYMRLCFAFYDQQTLEEGVVRLRDVLAVGKLR